MSTSKGWVKRVWRFLTSMQLGIILLIVITASSAAGSVIPQREELALYFEMYGRSLAPALLSLGLTDMFHSPWFIALGLSIPYGQKRSRSPGCMDRFHAVNGRSGPPLLHKAAICLGYCLFRCRWCCCPPGNPGNVRAGSRMKNLKRLLLI